MTTENVKGNFVAFANRYKKRTDDRPNFDGRIAIPGTEREFRMAVWAATDKHGKVMFSGQSADISASDSALEQIASMAGVGADMKTLEDGGITLKPGQLVMFANGFKDEQNPTRPDFYGRWNPGDGKVVDISAWARTNERTGAAYLSGQTQYRQKGKNPALDGAAMGELDKTVEKPRKVAGQSR